MLDAAMSTEAVSPIADAVDSAAQPLTSDAMSLDAVIELALEGRIVLIGEASHGTHEFYRTRAQITERLIRDHGFDAVAVEADWPNALRVSHWLRGCNDDANAHAALGDFTRFPAWMWRNTDVLVFLEWLRGHNDTLERTETVGFYGLDLYTLHASMDAVLAYLDKVDPEAARRARYRYSCFDHFGEDPQAYGYAASYGLAEDCQREVLSQLLEMRQKASVYGRRDGRAAEDEYFFAEQNARLAVGAEAYYRTMFEGRVSSWNLRDRHMADTLEALDAHLTRQRGRPARIVVWEHNSHLGDARATEMGDHGECNVGQFARERWGNEAVSIGFSTHGGFVTAATDWGGAPERKQVKPSLEGSYERIFHNTGRARFFLNLREESDAREMLRQRRLQRAIGVIYRPETERYSHYFRAELPAQFDGIIHVDATRAVEPIDPGASWVGAELPDTFPSGL
jgi:erythromycin esterase-like protein